MAKNLIKILPRKYSCIMLACIDYPLGAENWSMREYMISILDTILRGIPDCGVILTGDFNQFKDTFLRTHNGDEQLVKIATRNCLQYWTKCGITCHLYMASCQLLVN